MADLALSFKMRKSLGQIYDIIIRDKVGFSLCKNCQRGVEKICDENEIKMKDDIGSIQVMVSFTTDSWSSRIYKNYLAFTMY